MAIASEQLRTQNEVQRKTHGAMHASRVAALVPIILSLYQKYGDKEALSLSKEDILLAQIAALFHDAARESDGVDQWDSKSAELCYNYFKNIGLDDHRARFFSNCARHKDTLANKTIIHKIIHDADALEVIRLAYQFRIEELDFYQYIAKENPNALEDIKQISKELRDLIARQNDLKHKDHKQVSRIAIGKDADSIIEGGEAIESTFDLLKKKKYEHANNYYLQVTKYITNYKTLQKLNNSLATTESKDFIKKTESKENKASSLSEKEKALLDSFLTMDLYLHHTTTQENFESMFESKEPALRGAVDRDEYGNA